MVRVWARTNGVNGLLRHYDRLLTAGRRTAALRALNGLEVSVREAEERLQEEARVGPTRGVSGYPPSRVRPQDWQETGQLSVVSDPHSGP